jgi:hypothetical protein
MSPQAPANEHHGPDVQDSEMNKNAKRLIDRMRNDLRALGHSRRDHAQARLLRDLAEALGDLEIELLTAIEESERRKLCVDQE